MKVSVNNEHLFELNETKKKVICYDIHQDQLDDDLKRRLEWALMEKYRGCFKRLKLEWDPKLLENGIKMIPTDPDEYAQLVFSQPNYECRAQREKNVEKLLEKNE